MSEWEFEYAIKFGEGKQRVWGGKADVVEVVYNKENMKGK